MLDDIDTNDHAQAMIDWLVDKDPDVWFAITRDLNWDTSDRVLDWIISQPRCDKANAAWVFWAADPAYYAMRLAAGETPRGDGYRLLQKVLRQWRAGFYTRAELGWQEEEGAIERYGALPIDRFVVPEDLKGPFDGREPIVPASAQPRQSVRPYDLLHALGTTVEIAPGSEAFHMRAELETWRVGPRRLQNAGGVSDVLSFWGEQAGWFGALLLFAAGTAYALHWAAVF